MLQIIFRPGHEYPVILPYSRLSETERSLNAQEAYFNSPQWLYVLSNLQGYNSEIDYDWDYDDCSACRSEPEPSSASAPNISTMGFDEYNLGFM